MKIRPPSVRARLTLWHAGVLTLIVCIFSAGILHFVDERLYTGLDTQLERQCLRAFGYTAHPIIALLCLSPVPWLGRE